MYGVKFEAPHSEAGIEKLAEHTDKLFAQKTYVDDKTVSLEECSKLAEHAEKLFVKKTPGDDNTVGLEEG